MNQQRHQPFFRGLGVFSFLAAIAATGFLLSRESHPVYLQDICECDLLAKEFIASDDVLPLTLVINYREHKGGFPVGSIILVEPSREGPYSLVYMEDPSTKEISEHLVMESIDDIERLARQAGDDFLWRPHRRNLVNLRFVKGFLKSSGEYYLGTGPNALRVLVSNNKLSDAERRFRALCRLTDCNFGA